MHSRLFTVRFSRVTFLAVAWMALGPISTAHSEEKKPEAKKPAKITYDEHIKPIFRAKCFSCHNPDKKSSGLDLTNFTNLMQGGGSGEVIERGSTTDSYLYSLVSHESEPFMPPNSEKLPKEMLDLIAAWINGGALENSGSKAFVSKKPKFDMVLSTSPSEKPAEPPLPGRLSLEPVVTTLQKSAVTALATSPWAPVVAVAGQKQVLLYHSQSLEPLGVLPFPEGVPQVLKFSRNGSLLLAGGGQGALRGKTVAWNVKTGRRVLDVGDELDTVLAADISSDHSMIALGGPNKIVRIYSTADGKLLHEISKHTDWVTSIEFSPDGVLLATGDRNGGLFVWEAHTAREYLSLRAHSNAVSGLSWRIDSNVLASCSEDGSLRLWEMVNGGQVKNWGAHGGGASSVEFTRDGRLVSCGRDRVTKLWNQNGKQLRAFPAFSDIALRVTHCDETNRVVAGDWTGAIRVWNAADGKQLGELNSNPPNLAARLETASKLLSAGQAEHQKLAAAYQSAQAAADKVKADLAAAQKTAAETQKLLQTAQNNVKQHGESVTKLTGELQTATKTAATLQPLLDPLKDSVAKAQQAASKASDDKELAAVVAQLKAQFDKKTAAHTAAVKTAAEKKTALDKTNKDLAASEKQVSDLKATLTAAEKKVADITPTVKPAVEKAVAAKKSADTAAAALTAAQNAVNHWKNEIALLAKLEELATRQAGFDELQLAFEEAQGAADKLKTERDAANRTVTDAQKKADAASAAVETARKKLTQLTADHQAAAKLVTSLETALPTLKTAAEQGKAAAEKIREDKELADAAAKLKAAFDRKTAELGTLKKSAAEKAAAVETAKSQLSAVEKQSSEAAAVLAEAKKTAAEAESRFNQAQQKADEAKATAAAAKQEIDNLRAAL